METILVFAIVASVLNLWLIYRSRRYARLLALHAEASELFVQATVLYARSINAYIRGDVTRWTDGRMQAERLTVRAQTLMRDASAIRRRYSDHRNDQKRVRQANSRVSSRRRREPR